MGVKSVRMAVMKGQKRVVSFVMYSWVFLSLSLIIVFEINSQVILPINNLSSESLFVVCALFA